MAGGRRRPQDVHSPAGQGPQRVNAKWLFFGVGTITGLDGCGAAPCSLSTLCGGARRSTLSKRRFLTHAGGFTALFSERNFSSIISSIISMLALANSAGCRNPLFAPGHRQSNAPVSSVQPAAQTTSQNYTKPRGMRDFRLDTVPLAGNPN